MLTVTSFEAIISDLLKKFLDCRSNFEMLTPKLLWPVFYTFMKFGQPILVRVSMLKF